MHLIHLIKIKHTWGLYGHSGSCLTVKKTSHLRSKTHSNLWDSWKQCLPDLTQQISLIGKLQSRRRSRITKNHNVRGYCRTILIKLDYIERVKGRPLIPKASLHMAPAESTKHELSGGPKVSFHLGGSALEFIKLPYNAADSSGNQLYYKFHCCEENKCTDKPTVWWEYN